MPVRLVGRRWGQQLQVGRRLLRRSTRRLDRSAKTCYPRVMTDSPSIARTIKVGGTIFYLRTDGVWTHKFLNRRGKMVYAKVSSRQLERIQAHITEERITE